jgi:hypothetical protein
MLTQERLKEVVYYDPHTGIFTWIKRVSNRISIGQVVGYKEKTGYIQIRILCGSYRAHRLAWLYVYGNLPKDQIDHVNGIRTDNRICNLREATHQQNCQNLHKALPGSSSGLLGAWFAKRENKWTSQITLNGKRKWIGYYNTPEEAHEAYIQAKRKLHEYCDI